MAKRLISLSELDEIEGLVERHRKLEERLEANEADAGRDATGERELKSEGFRGSCCASPPKHN